MDEGGNRKVDALHLYAAELKAQYATGHAAEHAYRPALKALMEQLGRVAAVNDPKRSEHGAPDFVFLQRGTETAIQGWAETKDLTANLDKVEKSEQLQRYAGYPNLFLTNYVEFRFYSNGARYDEVEIADLRNGALELHPERYEVLADALRDFLAKPPEPITNGKRLAEVMGAKARRIRHNVERFLSLDSDRNEELLRIFDLIKTLLVHDMDEVKFADMYAQTLVYGLFAARYNDATSDSFSRAEARDLVPPSNPFLREFFDHIAGPRFDRRLGFIVDELCEVFRISDVRSIVHRHLDSAESGGADDRDPIIHFYEDFLSAYDPEQRKEMGAYYTPLPIVRFMVRSVDEILVKEFGLKNGLADTSKVTRKVLKQEKRVKVSFHQVQILDPAVGTATFLNEIVRFIRDRMEGQEGRWPAYARDDLIPRLHGFELMMAPYTIAHLKLGLTLQESGVSEFGRRLGIYLTNTLEEGLDVPQNLLQIGLTEAVAQEALQAGEIKLERPVMIVMGNPPYRAESSNNTDFAKDLVQRYKFEPGGTRKLQERNPKWLNDDYVKFIAFAETMVKRNGTGIVAMITNHGYLTNPTFRGMRWRLLQTFDSIHVLDLHGSSKRKEVAPDGAPDKNVFDIQQGVAILIAVMTGKKEKRNLAEVFHADLWGSRAEKFAALSRAPEWKRIELRKPSYNFAAQGDDALWEKYEAGVGIKELFTLSNVGVVTSADKVVIGHTPAEIGRQIKNTQASDGKGQIVKRLKDHEVDLSCVVPLAYRPFDERMIYYDPRVLERAREKVMNHFIAGANVGLVSARGTKNPQPDHFFITDRVTEAKFGESSTQSYVFPLYSYDDDGVRSSNLNPRQLSRLTANLSEEVSPLSVLDYVYGVLFTPAYREKYKGFLRSDFPRVPVPAGDDEFQAFSRRGKRLRELHLPPSDGGTDLITTYPVAGSDEVTRVQNRDAKVWINDQQYFGGVSEAVWEFSVGGYQPAQKWLKDRVGQTLRNADIERYQAMIASLGETIEIMREEPAARSW